MLQFRGYWNNAGYAHRKRKKYHRVFKHPRVEKNISGTYSRVSLRSRSYLQILQKSKKSDQKRTAAKATRASTSCRPQSHDARSSKERESSREWQNPQRNRLGVPVPLRRFANPTGERRMNLISQELRAKDRRDAGFQVESADQVGGIDQMLRPIADAAVFPSVLHLLVFDDADGTYWDGGAR